MLPKVQLINDTVPYIKCISPSRTVNEYGNTAATETN